MNCPVCTTALSVGSHEGHELAGCATCGGRFVSFESLRGIAADATRPRSEHERAESMDTAGTAATVAADDRPALPCPSCSDPMRRYVHQYASGVWVDACEVHGIWLDAGELERLEAYAEATVDGMSPTNLANVGSLQVGVEQARIATTPDVWDRIEPMGRGTSIGMNIDAFSPVPGVFGMLGQLVDGASSWRRLDRSAASQREQQLIDDATRDGGTP